MHRLSSNLNDVLPGSTPDATSDIPEDVDLMSSDDMAQDDTPPPRIATRFSKRPSINRRRSSAASSRRNSLSSTHSHHSRHSYHGAQSRYIAQHLRRASIIESRKARLADRAAHAEAVRMRAAMAKAAMRPSNSEERALAAQQAREKILAQVAAACAEEVRRAKNIAEGMKEKREAEGRKLREVMEERLADAERRRTELLDKRNTRRGRATSIPRAEDKRPVRREESSEKRETAVRKIQKAWRIVQRRKAVKDFTELGLSIEGVRDTSFEEVGALLSQERVIKTTAKVLQLCGLQDGELGGAGETSAVRTFLSAFLVLGHPAQVLSSDGEQEQVHTSLATVSAPGLADALFQDLIKKSKDLLISFEHLLSSLTASNSFVASSIRSQSLSEAYVSFLTAFSAWKAHDSSVLVQTMIAQFIELDLIWQKVKNETEEVTAEYRQGIREQQVLLLVRIKRLAGPEKAKRLIRDAMREAHKSRVKKPAGDVRPRVTPAESPVDQIPQDRPQRPRESMQFDELLKSMSSIPDNRLLVHELAINREYRIGAGNAVTSHVRETLNRAVFDGMRRDIQAGVGDRWIVAMVENLRDRLLRLLQPHQSESSLYTVVSETLDPVLIENECRRGRFSYERFFAFMQSILPKMCAPARDVDVKAFAEDRSGDSIDRLARLVRVIDLLVLDHANFMLQISAPDLIREAPGYEERRFAQDIATGSTSLEKTKRWWLDAREKVLAELARRDIEGSNQQTHRPTFEKIYFRGLTNIAIATSKLQEDELPETLHLDTNRIMRFRRRSLRIIAVGSILLTAKNLLKRDVRTQWKIEADRIWKILKDNESSGSTSSDAAAEIISTIEFSHALPPATKVQLGNIVARVLAQVQAGQITDPVMRLLFQRLKTHIFVRLSATSANDRVRVASTASEGLASSGLPEYIGMVGQMVEELMRVSDVDRKSHHTWYEKITAETV
ncbi:hypothetical protein FGG08_007010 [Glutinoglossum americanum]|uniref:T-complex protein 11-like protein 1 n=1 Tax=Glutinoglossum americanum TaxID=1670608 RepID=A0A9P8I670_9PEZI|nr:hypothetical protein FGG08_007010 [Glutinoglossum americanum]